MTTRITVKNEDDSHHDIVLTFAGGRKVVHPGDSLTTHIWKDSGMLIEEVPTQRRGPAGYGAMPPGDVK